MFPKPSLKVPLTVIYFLLHFKEIVLYCGVILKCKGGTYLAHTKFDITNRPVPVDYDAGLF